MSARADTSAPARPDRRAARRQQSKDEIVAAAWDLVREHGLAGLAMRDLGDRVGMKAQSIYSYFASKHEIYDAMFHQGYLAFAAAIAEVKSADTDRAGSVDESADALHLMAHRFFEFCISDPVRYQLLFQRTIPEFVPSDASYAVAVEAYHQMNDGLAAIGITDPQAVDLWTALLTGLSDQQISNDPGGDRWERLIDRAVAMFLHDNNINSSAPTQKGNR